LLKSITGSSLKGKCDPIFDNLSEEKKKKWEHLDLLERKGFEVTELKQKFKQQDESNNDLLKS